MKNLPTSISTKKFTAFIERYHLLMFFVLVFGGLSLAVFLLYQVVVSTDDANGYTPTVSNTSLDEDTIKELRRLDRTTLSSDLELYGRTNPF